MVPTIITGLLLIEMGLTFECSVGVMGQIRTLSSIVAVVFSLLMGVLCVLFKHKSLLLTGLFFVGVSALGCSFAPNFTMILIFYSLTGSAIAVVVPMATTLVGEHFSLEKRASAMGWVIAGMSLSYLIGAPIVSFIAGLGGWQMTFLGFVLPIAILGFLLVAMGLPSTSSGPKPTMSKASYSGGFKEVFSNKSASACLIGFALSAAGWQAILLYSISFFRQQFRVSTDFATVILSGAALCYTFGSLVGGRLVNRLGRKTLTVLGCFLLGMFTISFTNLPSLWLSLAFSYLGTIFAGIRYTASSSLTLEQVPRFRGTMMSIFSAADSLGSAFGAGLGGLALLLYNYELLGIFLGALGVAAAMILHLLVIDPTRTQLNAPCTNLTNPKIRITLSQIHTKRRVLLVW